MFTGIIETTGSVSAVSAAGKNKSFWVASAISEELSVDQSVSHDGVCLTIEEIKDSAHRVTAIAETLKKSNLDSWKPGTLVNLERSLKLDGRLDGHFVQGHVDGRAKCTDVRENKGSWEYKFSLEGKFAALLIEKGSICVNGISLTAFDVKKKSFKVAIIPYTYEHTNIKALAKGDEVNIEFDLIGKYISRKLSLEK